MAEVKGIFDIGSIIDNKKTQTKPHTKPQDYISKDNKLERSPSADDFSSSQKEETSKNRIKYIGMIAIGALAAYAAYAAGKHSAAEALTAAADKNQDYEKTIEGLRQTILQNAQKTKGAGSEAFSAAVSKSGGVSSVISEAAPAIEDAALAGQKASLSEQEKLLRQISDALEPQLQNDEAAQKAQSMIEQSILEELQKAKLSYNPLEAPAEKIDMPLYGRRIFKISEVPPFKPAADSGTGIIQTAELKAEFASTGSLELTLPSTDKVHPVSSADAFIGSKTIENLNRTVNTQITSDYGKRINWSERKIARDIIQNFYDGNGNTLDGVSVSLQRSPEGVIKIKISGAGTYNYENLQLLGSGNKIENGFNAGGFGEGSKILTANLIGKGDTEAVTYACADWTYTLSAPEEGSSVIRQTLRKAPGIINGSSIEFETKNQELADAVIDAVNYFEHSKNPDFQNLTFDSPNFAFRILDKKEAGNVYLTQRFEFDGDGKWDNPAASMGIIFKRKPDADEYFKIIGEKLPQDRDRTSLTFNDIQNLTRYFAHGMTDDEIMQSILSTKHLWGTKELSCNASERSALLSFLKGLIKEAHSRNIKLDIQDERLVSADFRLNDTVYNALSAYGYKFLPEFFYDIGIESSSQAFRKLSVHTPLAPSETEIKKLKLLEQGLEIVQQNIQQALKRHLKNPDIQFNPKGCRDYWFIEIIKELSGSAKDFEYLRTNGFITEESLRNLSDEELQKLCSQVSDKLKTLLSSMAENPDTKTIGRISELVSHLDSSAVSAKTKDYCISLKDYSLITAQDVKKPRYIFDRHSETAQNTLGEALISNDEYNGHWVDREYLNTADFYQLLGTWIHECCHKAGGDGSSEFTYALTDMLRVLLRSNSSKLNAVKLNALSEVFNKLQA